MKDLQDMEDLLFTLTSENNEEEAQFKADVNEKKTRRKFVDLQFQAPPPVATAVTIMSDEDLDKQISDSCDTLVPLFEEHKRRFDAIIKLNVNGVEESRKSTMLAFIFSISGGESQFEVNEHLVGRDADLLALARGRYGHSQPKVISETIKEKRRHVKGKYNMELSEI